MTAIHWLNAINGSFTNASDWSGGTVPGASDDAILDAAGGAPYTVTSSASVSVGSIQTASGATLAITAGTFSASAGSASGANAGLILVSAGAGIVAEGVLDNTGTIAIGGGRGSASLTTEGNLTLSGGGHIVLSDRAHNAIGGAKEQAALIVNLDNTISGAGVIAGAYCAFQNGTFGVVDATGTSALTIRNEGFSLVNDGILEATGSGGLTIEDRYVENGSAGVTLKSSGT
jgi:hypothetical protein